MHYKWGLCALIALFIAGSFIVLSNFDKIGWDEAVYVGMGKRIFSAGSSGLWDSPRAPVLPAIAGVAWKLGLDPLSIGRAFSIIMTAASICIIFLIGKTIFSEKAALIAATIFATTPSIIYLHTKFLTEMPSIFFLLLAIYTFIKSRENKSLILAGIWTAISFIIRLPQGLWIGVLILATLLWPARNRAKEILMLATGFAIIAIPATVLMLITGFLKNAPKSGGLILPSLGLITNFLIKTLSQSPFYLFVIPQIAYYILMPGQNDYRKKTLTLGIASMAAYLSLNSLTYSLETNTIRYAIVIFPCLSILAARGIEITLTKINNTEDVLFRIAKALTLCIIFTLIALFATAPFLEKTILRSNKDLAEFASRTEFNRQLTTLNGTIITNNPWTAIQTDNRIELTAPPFDWSNTPPHDIIALDSCLANHNPLPENLISDYKQIFLNETEKCRRAIYKKITY
jgi:4-amino-4-deoxy-L-arabinose transferase-like glycosyltransferase